jgi:hypothetical protein
VTFSFSIPVAAANVGVLRSAFGSNGLLRDHRQNCIRLQKNTVRARFSLACLGKVRLSLGALHGHQHAPRQNSKILFDNNWLGVPSNLFSVIEFCEHVAVNLAAFSGAFGASVAAACSIRKTDDRSVDAMRISGRNPLASKQRNTMRKFFLVVTLFSLSAVTGAIAEQTPQKQRSGTPDEQRACSRDVQKHCRSVMNEDDLTVLACLQHNRPKLTAACNQVLVSHGQ